MSLTLDIYNIISKHHVELGWVGWGRGVADYICTYLTTNTRYTLNPRMCINTVITIHTFSN